MPESTLRYLITIAVCTIAYAIMARIGLLFAAYGENGTLFFPAAGIAVGLLLLLGWRYFPGIVLGVFLGASSALPYYLIITFATGATLEALFAYFLITKFNPSFNPALINVKDLIDFLLLAGIFAMTVSPSIGILGISLSSHLPIHTLGEIWIVWWIGSILGVLLFGSAFMVAYSAVVAGNTKVIVNSALMSLVAFALAYITYRNHLPEAAVQLALFLPFIVSLIGALNQSQLCVTTSNLAIAIAAVWAISDHVGPLYQADIQNSLLFLNGTVGIGSLLMMILAAAMIERDTSAAKLKTMQNQMEGEIQERTHYLEKEIEARKRFEKRLINVAQRDELTRLPNRKLLLEQMLVTFTHADRDRLKAAILFIDLDKFKPINDQHGHDIGDKVLRIIANRLTASIRDCDLKGRWGGDEFVVVLTNLSKLDIVPEILKHTIDEIEKPIRLGVIDCHLSASIGIAIYPHDGIDPEQLIGKADIAMYRAKPKRADKIAFYTESMPE